MRRKIAVTLMITGFVLILSAAALLFYNYSENKKAEEQSLQLINNLKDYISQHESNFVPDAFEKEMTIVDIDGYGYIGYLYIPDLEVDLPVMADWDYTRLKISPCRYYGSTYTDNLVIAAHNYSSHFGYIGNLQKGAYVMFTDMDSNVTTYQVTSVELLNPTDVDKVKDTGDDLILYTCTYGGAQRITVRCEIAGER